VATHRGPHLGAGKARSQVAGRDAGRDPDIREASAIPIFINTNITAMNAQRNLSVTNMKMSRALEQLSSGLRVNRAADDAAGLTISEKMRAQIRGLRQGLRNAQDGISLIQTAEGALNDVHAILQRMRELTTQAGSTILSTADRQAVSEEMVTLRSEIDNIATRRSASTAGSCATSRTTGGSPRPSSRPARG